MNSVVFLGIVVVKRGDGRKGTVVVTASLRGSTSRRRRRRRRPCPCRRPRRRPRPPPRPRPPRRRRRPRPRSRRRDSCGSGYDCIAINGRRWDDPSRIAVCRPSVPGGKINKCQNGRSTATCGRSIDCIPPGGAATKGVCRHGRCQWGTRGASCGRNHDCICNSCSIIGGETGECTTSYCHGKYQESNTRG